jgi:WD40-like Beta Propeller Repeat
VVLFEMLLGEPVFSGRTAPEILASVIKDSPDWTRLPDSTPRPITRLLHRCLERDRKRRLHDVADARFELEDALAEPVPERDRGRPSPTGSGSKLLLWAVGALLVVLAGAGAFWANTGGATAPSAPSLRLRVRLGADLAWPGGLAVSPDGRHLAFVATQSGESERRIFYRALDQLDARPLAGTERAWTPFFSPDGEWIGFFADGELRKLDVRGGEPISLAAAVDPRGASWSEDGTILFSPRGAAGEGLRRIPDSGGAADVLTDPAIHEDEVTHRWPQALADGRVL